MSSALAEYHKFLKGPIAAKIVPGTKLFLRYYHTQGRLLHIRAIVDMEYVVFRYWARARWNYEVRDMTLFFVSQENIEFRGKSQ